MKKEKSNLKIENKKIKELNNKYILIIVFFSLLFFSFNIFASRDLEVDYPEISGSKPDTTGFPIQEYALYIYNFVIYTAGFIAFLAIVISGLMYLSSAGNPTMMQEAKDRIKKAILGLVIILSSHLLLNLIYSGFTTLDFKEPGDIAPIIIDYPDPEPVDYGVIQYSPDTIDLLERVEKLTKDIKKETNMIRKTAYDLRDNADFCDCIRGEAICQ